MRTENKLMKDKYKITDTPATFELLETLKTANLFDKAVVEQLKRQADYLMLIASNLAFIDETLQDLVAKKQEDSNE